MRTAEHTPADLLEAPPKVLPEQRRSMLLPAADRDPFA